MSELDFRVDEEWAKFARENSFASFIPEFAKDSTGQEFMRKRGSSVAYKIKTESEKEERIYECSQCGSEILDAKVAHPIWVWDGIFPLSGCSRNLYELVPYCPKCEEKPKFSGTPVEVR